MAFGKVSKQDLIDAGLDPDKFNELIGKSVTKDELESLKTTLTTSITQTLKDELAAMETRLRTPVNNNDDNNNNDDKNRQKTQAELEEEQNNEFLTNPTGFIRKQNQALAAGTIVELKKIARDNAWREASRTLKGFGNAEIRKEIEEEWKKYTPQILAQNNADPADMLVKIHNMVMGAHLEEIQQDTNKREGKYNMVQGGGGSSGPGGTMSDSTDDKKKISDVDHKQAVKYGMTDEEWLKQQTDMEKEQEERMAGKGAN